MQSFQRVAASIAFSALMAAGATCAGAEDEPLGVRLVNQMNALYGEHPGVRANHAKGAVFEGMFTPAQGADALSSAVFLKGAPTPLIIRFSNAGGVPDAPDTHPSTDRVRGMAIKFRLSDGSEQDIVSYRQTGFRWRPERIFWLCSRRSAQAVPTCPSRRRSINFYPPTRRHSLCHHAAACGGQLRYAAVLRRQRVQVHQCARNKQVRPLPHRARERARLRERR